MPAGDTESSGPGRALSEGLRETCYRHVTHRLGRAEPDTQRKEFLPLRPPYPLLAWLGRGRGSHPSTAGPPGSESSRVWLEVHLELSECVSGATPRTNVSAETKGRRVALERSGLRILPYFIFSNFESVFM